MSERPIYRATEAYVVAAEAQDELEENLREVKQERADALKALAEAAGLEGMALGPGSPLTREIARAMKLVAEEAYKAGLEHGRSAPRLYTDPRCGVKFLSGTEEFACNDEFGHSGSHSHSHGKAR